MNLTVEVTEEELAHVRYVARARNEEAQASERRAFNGAPHTGPVAIVYNAWGALGECAVAKAIGIEWKPSLLPDSDVGDVDGWHVRGTDLPHGRLILHPKDADEAPFVLAICDPPIVRLEGWLIAREGKRGEFWCDPTRTGRPAFFVPRGLLNDMIFER